MRIVLFLCATMFSFSAVALEIVREGDVIAAKDSDKWCYVLDLSQIGSVIPEGESTLYESITRLFSYELVVGDVHRRLCGIATGGVTELVWRVAKNRSAVDRPAKRLVTDAGEQRRVSSSIRIPVGTDCADDDNNQYTAGSSGGRQWRNHVDHGTDIVVLCEQIEVTVVADPGYSRKFNFRNSPGYIDDNENKNFAGLPYAPGTGHGWESGNPGFRDRESEISELSGVAFVKHNEAQAVFRVDLPAPGQYAVRVAIGDAQWAHTNVYAEILDGDTVIIQSMGPTGISLNAGEFVDASGSTLLTPAEWVSWNRPFVYEFKTNILRLKIGLPTDGEGSSFVAHLSISSIAQ